MVAFSILLFLRFGGQSLTKVSWLSAIPAPRIADLSNPGCAYTTLNIDSTEMIVGRTLPPLSPGGPIKQDAAALKDRATRQCGGTGEGKRSEKKAS